MVLIKPIIREIRGVIKTILITH